MKYASATKVSTDKSRSEIEKILQKYGATGFMYGWQRTQAIVGFQYNNIHIRFDLPMPDKNSDEFIKTPGRKKDRNIESAYKAWEQAGRQRCGAEMDNR